MRFNPTRIMAATAAAAACVSVAPGVASAAGPVQLHGSVTRLGLSDPFPNPTATYKGWVDDTGNLTVEADCVKNALIPSMPCHSGGGPATTVRWQNTSTHKSGSVQFLLGRASVNAGKGSVRVQVTGGLGAFGAATGTYTI